MSRRTSLPGAAELFRTTGAGAGGATTAPVAEPPAPFAPEAPEATAPVIAAVPVIAAPDRVDVPAAERPAADRSAVERPAAGGAGATRAVRQTGRRMRPAAERMPSGRERHEEKITVYCSAEELVDIESVRLALRAEHGMAVDRGRIVREAIAVVLADFEAKGDASILVRRLRDA